MRPASPMLAEVLNGSRTVSSTIAVYYDGVSVLDEVPISTGSLDVDSSQDVPASLTVSVPRYIVLEDGSSLDLMPVRATSPLACDGTRIAVTYRAAKPGAPAEALNLGWYRIQEWEEGDGTIDLTATGLEAVVQESTFLNPATTTPGVAYSTTAAALLAKLLPLRVTADAAKITAAQTYEDDRLAALADLVTSWPARMLVDDSGTLVIAPPFDDTTDPVVLTLTDGENGTVVQAPRSGTRDDVYNAVKASGEQSGDVAPVSAVAYLTEGPYRWNGPFGNVPYFYSSPLLTTVAACQAAARTRLASIQARISPVTIEAAPDPRIEVGDVLALNYRDVTKTLRVDSLSLPLTAADGTMSIAGHEVTR